MIQLTDTLDTGYGTPSAEGHGKWVGIRHIIVALHPVSSRIADSIQEKSLSFFLGEPA